MSNMDERVPGLWYCVESECGGVRLSKQQIAERGRYVLIANESCPGWHGIWGIVKYGYQGGSWSSLAIEASCRQIILGTIPAQELPADFYLLSGGRFRAAPHQSPKQIDFETYWRGDVLPSSMNLGIYKIEPTRLVICFGGSSNPRPNTFSGGFCDELTRLESSDGATQN